MKELIKYLNLIYAISHERETAFFLNTCALHSYFGKPRTQSCSDFHKRDRYLRRELHMLYDVRVTSALSPYMLGGQHFCSRSIPFPLLLRRSGSDSNMIGVSGSTLGVHCNPASPRRRRRANQACHNL